MVKLSLSLKGGIGGFCKGAGTFHSAGQSEEGNLVLALPSIRFSRNFYQIISGTKYEYKTFFGPITCHSWQDNGKNGHFFMEFWPIFDIFHWLRPYLCPKRGYLGFHKQATHERHDDEPFFHPGVNRSKLGMAQKWSILDHKGSNMAGLSTLQSGPKGSKRDQNGQTKCFWPLGTLLGPSGPLWTISDKNDFFAPNGQSRGWQSCFGAKHQFLFEMVKKGPDGPKMVKNT